MKELTYYALETLVCSGVLLAAYVILLERRVHFGWCRAYLLLSTVAAALIPLLRIPVWPAEVIRATPVVTAGAWDIQAEIVADPAPALAPETVAMLIYAGGALLILALMLWQAVRIRGLRRGAVVSRAQGITLVRTRQQIASFSFFRAIYVWQGVPDSELPAILAHETSHIRHRHSAERIAMECLKALLWWNPFAWIAARRLTEAEEFEADSDVLAGGFDVENYMHVLLKQLFGYTPEIANGLRNSLTKKRFLMMTTKKSGRYALLRLAGTLPVVMGLLVAFSFTSRAAVIVLPDTQPETAAPAACKVNFLVTKEGQPLPGAIILIAGTDRGTTTDPQGKAHLTAAPGTQFEISHIGCETRQTALSPDEQGAEVMIVTQLMPDNSASAAEAQPAPAAPRKGESAKPGEQPVRVHVTLMDKDGKGFSSRNVAAGAIVKHANSERGTVTDAQGNARIVAAKGAVLEVQYPGYAPCALVVDDPRDDYGVLLSPEGSGQQDVALFSRDNDGVKRSPLYIYDGVERSDLSNVDIRDVATLSVLGDEQAKSLYGERGRYGVIVITSKEAEKRAAEKRASDDPETPFLVAETMPRFRGGDLMTFRSWIQSEVQYPAEAMKQKLQGRVVVAFIIERDGSLTILDILQSPDKLLTDEVRRVMARIPAGSWTPGMQKGQPVRVKMLVPVDFRLETVAAADTLIKRAAEVSDQEVYVVVETMPSFQGGNLNKFRMWVQSQVRYPVAALQNNIQGRVVATFIIEKDGSLSDIQILATPDSSLSDEARRILAATPAGSWKPGSQKGKAVRVKYTIPIDFRIAGQQAPAKREATSEKAPETTTEKSPGTMDEVVVVGFGTLQAPAN
ncbi:TonB family protein [Alistipes sp.]|uniref:TonB family protein n=1 Tax=Alistipes sp. TaxID=1872444 RepID=UPI003AEFC64B